MRPNHIRFVKILVHAAYRWPMLRGWCMLSAVDVTQLMCTDNGWCAHVMDDVALLWLMSPRRYVQAMTTVAESMRTRHDWCVQDHSIALFHWPMLLGWCVQALVDVAWRWPTSFTRCAHDTSVHARLGWCPILLDDIPYKIRKFHISAGRIWLK